MRVNCFSHLPLWSWLLVVACATAVDDPEYETSTGGSLNGSGGDTPSSGGSVSATGGTTSTSGGTTSTGGITSSGGTSSGGMGGEASGGDSTGGDATGGTATGGDSTGGTATGGTGTGGEATGGGDNGTGGGPVLEGDCADKPTWQNGGNYAEGDQVLFVCTISHGQAQCAGLEIGATHLFECVDSHAPNCAGQSPEGGSAWAYVTTCEQEEG